MLTRYTVCCPTVRQCVSFVKSVDLEPWSDPTWLPRMERGGNARAARTLGRVEPRAEQQAAVLRAGIPGKYSTMLAQQYRAELDASPARSPPRSPATSALSQLHKAPRPPRSAVWQGVLGVWGSHISLCAAMAAAYTGPA